MNARVTCSSCGQVYEIPAEVAAKTLKCALCGALFRATQAPAAPPPLPPPVAGIAAPVPVIPIDAPPPAYGAPVPVLPAGTSWQPWIWGGVAFVIVMALAVGVTVARFSRVKTAVNSPKPVPAPRYVPPPPAPRQPTFNMPPTPMPAPRPVAITPSNPRPPMPSTRPSTRPANRVALVGPVQVILPGRGAVRGHFRNGIHNHQWTPYVGNTTQQADYAYFIVTEPQVEVPDGTPPLKEGDTFCSVSDWGVGPKATVDTATIKGVTYTRVHEGDVDRCYSAYINGEKVSIFHTAAATDNTAAGAGVRAIVESLQKRTPRATTRPITPVTIPPVERP